jgi:hypothetical protein
VRGLEPEDFFHLPSICICTAIGYSPQPVGHTSRTVFPLSPPNHWRACSKCPPWPLQNPHWWVLAKDEVGTNLQRYFMLTTSWTPNKHSLNRFMAKKAQSDAPTTVLTCSPSSRSQGRTCIISGGLKRLQASWARFMNSEQGGEKGGHFTQEKLKITYTHVVDCWFSTPMNGSLQLLIKKDADENKHICWRRSTYVKYHSRTRLSSRPGIRVCSSGWMTWRTSQRATQVWTSPASALSSNNDLMVGNITNCITFAGWADTPFIGSSLSPDPLSMLATVLHMRARGPQRSFSATSPLCRHKSTRVGNRESG